MESVKTEQEILENIIERHFDALVKDFKLNDNFFSGIEIIKKDLGLSKIKVIIVSGTITQLIEAFFRRPDVAKKLTEHQIDIKVEATELVIDKNGLMP